MPSKPHKIITSSGLETVDASHQNATDLGAAMASSLGHRHPQIIAAIQAACQSHLGSWQDIPAAIGSTEPMGEPFSAFAELCFLPSASEANEWAMRVARAVAGAVAETNGGGGNVQAAGDDRYRIVTLLGGDHGDTLACRSASGRIADQAVGGPLAPGFRHLVPGDRRALQKGVDSTVAAVMLAPVDWSRGGEPFDSDYLSDVRRVCDENGALLIIDETRLPAAISGQWFFHETCSVRPDMVTAAAGWTGGLPGGLMLLSDHVIEQLGVVAQDSGSRNRHRSLPSMIDEADNGISARSAGLLPQHDYPLLRAVVDATAAGVRGLGGPDRIAEVAQSWANSWQELAGGFEFIRKVETVGLWTVIQLDLPADEVIAALAKLCLRVIRSGETTLLACLPINVTAEELVQMLGTIRDAMETVERQPIES